MLTSERTTRKTDLPLPTFPGAVADAVLRAAIAWLGQFPIGANAGLRMQAPEQALIRSLYGGIWLGMNELAFPAQSRTEIRMIGVEAFRFFDQAAPPAAFKMARATATLASFTLYAL
jgi:hypothetical protein